MDSRSSTMKFYILALHTFQLLASSPFGLCDNRASIAPILGRYKRLLLLQVESTSPENSFPYGIYTSPPPLLSGAVPPISPQINSPPFGIYPPPPTPTPTSSKSMPPSPQNSSPTFTSPPPTPSGAIPPPLLSTPPPPTPSGTMPPPLLSTSPPPPSPTAKTPHHNSPKPPAVKQPPPNSNHSSPPPPPNPPKKPENAVWCVAKPTVPADLIQQALDYACGSGAGCDAIQPNGACYQPATLLSHASYAFNSYWQKRKQGGGTCDFGGTAMLVTVDPSYDHCSFTSN
ncbi:leucine-rich repeat extensin-like protein 3 [Lycium barbarum]|uniref:leucine-rich repeat extensin-like protein 3 n=1 Tax=Lycium barbarum TaxID=112863 RepID=UPI00293E187C|nr:leucine-rich repeat extensin-like protein 3 [Lycium barbarum]